MNDEPNISSNSTVIVFTIELEDINQPFKTKLYTTYIHAHVFKCSRAIPNNHRRVKLGIPRIPSVT